LQTAYGSLTTGLDLRAGQTLLIRGGTSALGLVATALAKDFGATVLSTTRRADRTQALTDHGVDYALVDTGQIASDVRQILPGGVDAALELVGTPTLPADVLQGYLDKIATAQLTLGPTHVYCFEDIREAHADMEHNRVVGKLVVR
jgi:NADPH:quinone reductase-like Zn-dependent oxidoreductase